MQQLFSDTCMIIVPSLLVWTFFFTVCADDSKVQKRRLRKSIERILEYINDNTKDGCPPTELNIIYKNKKFAIGIIKNEVNYHYSTYRIFINGDEAGVYHVLHHMFLNSYYFETKNKRHESEVISILHAGNKVMKKMNKPEKIKENGWDEYSYFK